MIKNPYCRPELWTTVLKCTGSTCVDKILNGQISYIQYDCDRRKILVRLV